MMEGLQSLLHRLQHRYFEMIEKEMRTEALLKGEEYYEATPALARMLNGARVRSPFRSAFDGMVDAYCHAILYGSSTFPMSMLRPSGMPLPPVNKAKLSGYVPSIRVIDDLDFSDIEKRIFMSTYATGKPKLFSGIHDAVFTKLTVEDPPCLLPQPPTPEKNRGPQPRKAHIHKRR